MTSFVPFVVRSMLKYTINHGQNKSMMSHNNKINQCVTTSQLNNHDDNLAWLDSILLTYTHISITCL